MAYRIFLITLIVRRFHCLVMAAVLAKKEGTFQVNVGTFDFDL
jgi:hypothetical protein